MTSAPEQLGVSMNSLILDGHELVEWAGSRGVLRAEPGRLLLSEGEPVECVYLIQEELKEALPPALYEELDELTPDVRDGTLEELSLAHAEILGWLEGLFQGTQLALQVQATRALDQMRRPSLPRDRRGGDSDEPDSRYL